MSTHVGQAKLRDALKEFSLRWARIRSEWDDQAARDFDAQVVQPLHGQVSQTVQAAARLQEVLARAARESGADEGSAV